MTPQVLNWIIAGAILFCIMMVFPLALQFYVRMKCKGRRLAAIITKAGPVEFKLLKVQDDFMPDGDARYIIKPGSELNKPVDYPISWPKMLDGFRKTVDCSLYHEGNGSPINWKSPQAKVIDSKELTALLDPIWLRYLIRGVVEETAGVTGKSKDRMWLFLAVGTSGISMILLFVVMYKLSSLTALINNLPKLIHP